MRQYAKGHEDLRLPKFKFESHHVCIIACVYVQIAFANITQKIMKMAVGNIKKTGIKKIAKPVLLLAIIKSIKISSAAVKVDSMPELDYTCDSMLLYIITTISSSPAAMPSAVQATEAHNLSSQAFGAVH